MRNQKDLFVHIFSSSFKNENLQIVTQTENLKNGKNPIRSKNKDECQSARPLEKHSNLNF